MGYDDKVADGCIADFDEQIAYLGPIKVLMYVNEEHYQVNEYGEKSIRRESRIIEQNINEYQPSFFAFNIDSNELNDNSELF